MIELLSKNDAKAQPGRAPEQVDVEFVRSRRRAQRSRVRHRGEVARPQGVGFKRVVSENSGCSFPRSYFVIVFVQI